MAQTIITTYAAFDYKTLLTLRAEYKANNNEDVVIKGDGHGNWRNILLTAQIHSIADVNEADHNRLNEIYSIPIRTITKENVIELAAIFARIAFIPNTNYKLIGDLLADRGQCDFFMLMLIVIMKKRGVNISILLSNHDQEFLSIYERKFNADFVAGKLSFLTNLTLYDQDESLQGLGDLLRRGVVDVKIVDELIPYYLSSLKLIDYNLAPDKSAISLITHAPFSLNNYKKLAQVLRLEIYDDSLPAKLANTIDNINLKYHALLEGKIKAQDHEIYENLLVKLTWSRWSEGAQISLSADDRIEFQPQHNGYPVYYIHGHDGPKCVPASKKAFVVCLDCYFAKTSLKEGSIVLYYWDRASDLTLKIIQ